MTRIRALVATDLGATWSLGDLAAALGVSPRTLQHRLTVAGTLLRDLTAAAQVEGAAAMLTGPEPSRCAIGFADQDHLTRVFRQRTGLTIAAWRRALAS